MTSTIDMQPVESSSLKAVGYDPETRNLRVLFHSGDQYDYQNVTADKHRSLIGAESIGRHLIQHIMPHHSWEKVK